MSAYSTSGNLEIDSLVTQVIDPDIPDGLVQNNKLFSVIFGDQMEYTPGGAWLQHPIALIPNPSQGNTAGTGQPIDINPAQLMVPMIFQWKKQWYTINFTLDEMGRAFQTKQAVVDFAKQKTKLALSSFVRYLSSQVWGTSASDPLAIDGMLDVLASSGTAYGTLYDTNYASNGFLPIYNSTLANASNVGMAKDIAQITSRASQEGSDTEYKEFIGITNPQVFGQIIQNEQYKQVLNDYDTAKLGFEKIMVQGIPIYKDYYCPGTNDNTTADNYLIIFPKEIFTYKYVFGKDHPSPVNGRIQTVNSGVLSYQNWWMGNMICKNRRMILAYKTLVA